ncbi:Protein N-acetyltransferase, RimJ/RimL family [Natronincola peptidivorans]|uniref:Protein N-acetyltransferase, RimJ/RimL family n=1 Tax=Natronincola peptidivorans TaxID=426128 RepID=A0A1I0AW44_9FIRM|nr:GNAT family N-acetyltransferase [Natronincola peptidivorans]SES98608.1 Protein N-acetyltransferase, RimJ/RimL family [Natronincola peptidivorans]
MDKINLIKEEDQSLIAKERRKYLDSLPVFQELFLELLVKEGTCYFIKVKEQMIGYVIINNEDTHILEYYSTSKSILHNKKILLEITKTLNVTSVYCKTFDYELLTAMNLITQEFTIDGILFREHVEKEQLLEKQFNERIAQESDLERIQQINDDFFESDDEMIYYIRNKNILLFQNQENQLIGCGLYQNIAYDYGYMDIGMLVNPAFRKRGYGTYIIKRLADICKEEGKTPICGCGYANKASLKTLVKAGFIPEHALLEYKL